MANLSALLGRGASAEIEAILAEARERASELLSQARSDAETLLAQRSRAAEAQHAAALIRAQSGAQLEAASLKLTAQHRAIEGVFEGVRAELEALRGSPRYRPVLAGLLEEAVSSFPEGGVDAVLVDPADLGLASEVAAASGLADRVEAEPGIGAGVRLRQSENITVENTLGQRLAALRDELASYVSGVLFGSED